MVLKSLAPAHGSGTPPRFGDSNIALDRAVIDINVHKDFPFLDECGPPAPAAHRGDGPPTI